MPTESNSSFRIDSTSLTYAFWTLRLWLGARALITGLEKFSAKITTQQPLLDASGKPDASGATVEVAQKVYGFSHYHAIPESLQSKFSEEPLLPAIFTTPFYALLGYALILLGLALLLGIRTRETLFAMGLLYISLTIGLILIAQDAGVSWLALHILLVVAALVLAPYNRFTITQK